MSAYVWWTLMYFRALLGHCGWDRSHLLMHLIDLFISFRRVALI